MDGVRAAQSALEQARGEHEEYDRLLELAKALRADAERADREVRRHEAGAAARIARSLRRDASEAVELDRRILAHGPDTTAAEGSASTNVEAALALWRNLPDSNADATAADESRPAGQKDVTEEQLHQLALDLEVVSPADPAVERRRVDAHAGLRASRRARTRRAWLAVVGLVTTLIGAAFLGVTCGAQHSAGPDERADPPSVAVQVGLVPSAGWGAVAGLSWATSCIGGSVTWPRHGSGSSTRRSTRRPFDARRERRCVGESWPSPNAQRLAYQPTPVCCATSRAGSHKAKPSRRYVKSSVRRRPTDCSPRHWLSALTWRARRRRRRT